MYLIHKINTCLDLCYTDGLTEGEILGDLDTLAEIEGDKLGDLDGDADTGDGYNDVLFVILICMLFVSDESYFATKAGFSVMNPAAAVSIPLSFK